MKLFALCPITSASTAWVTAGKGKESQALRQSSSLVEPETPSFARARLQGRRHPACLLFCCFRLPIFKDCLFPCPQPLLSSHLLFTHSSSESRRRFIPRYPSSYC
ncbi:uncharacterized protein BDV14DRAFT_95301 [Aspergillus stella-maris]|uniref:uncharacterized protein n=1 Tax=Aspergillus stella-maris TaxID=1810926 RepID=UPI003CCDE3AA